MLRGVAGRGNAAVAWVWLVQVWGRGFGFVAAVEVGNGARGEVWFYFLYPHWRSLTQEFVIVVSLHCCVSCSCRGMLLVARFLIHRGAVHQFLQKRILVFTCPFLLVELVPGRRVGYHLASWEGAKHLWRDALTLWHLHVVGPIAARRMVEWHLVIFLVFVDFGGFGGGDLVQEVSDVRLCSSPGALLLEAFNGAICDSICLARIYHRSLRILRQVVKHTHLQIKVFIVANLIIWYYHIFIWFAHIFLLKHAWLVALVSRIVIQLLLLKTILNDSRSWGSVDSSFWIAQTFAHYFLGGHRIILTHVDLHVNYRWFLTI